MSVLAALSSRVLLHVPPEPGRFSVLFSVQVQAPQLSPGPLWQQCISTRAIIKNYQQTMGWKSSVNSTGDGLRGEKLPEGLCVGVRALFSFSLLLHLLNSSCLPPPGSCGCLSCELEGNDCFCLHERGNTELLRFPGDPVLP